MLQRLFLAAGLAAACLGCSRSARVSVVISRPAEAHASFAGPAHAYSFDCVAVNVVADDIPSRSPDHFPVVSLASGSCSYPGSLSAAAAVPAAGGTVTLEVDAPIGSHRTVQVLGIELGASGLKCGEVDSEAIFPSSGGSPKIEAYELGQSTVNVTDDMSVEVANTYLASKLANCSKSTLTAGTYVGSCITDGDLFGAIPAAGASRRTVVISGSSMTLTHENFVSPSCVSTVQSTITQSMTYALGSAYSDVNGIQGYRVTLTYGDTLVTTSSPTSFNTPCGTSLVGGVSGSVAGQCSGATFTGNVAYPALGGVRYDIAAVSGTNLYFGKSYNSDGPSSPGAPLLVHTPGSAAGEGDRSTVYFTGGAYVRQ